MLNLIIALNKKFKFDKRYLFEFCDQEHLIVTLTEDRFDIRKLDYEHIESFLINFNKENTEFYENFIILPSDNSDNCTDYGQMLVQI